MPRRRNINLGGDTMKIKVHTQLQGIPETLTAVIDTEEDLDINKEEWQLLRQEDKDKLLRLAVQKYISIHYEIIPH